MVSLGDSVVGRSSLSSVVFLSSRNIGQQYLTTKVDASPQI